MVCLVLIFVPHVLPVCLQNLLKYDGHVCVVVLQKNMKNTARGYKGAMLFGSQEKYETKPPSTARDPGVNFFHSAMRESFRHAPHDVSAEPRSFVEAKGLSVGPVGVRKRFVSLVLLFGLFCFIPVGRLLKGQR